jgi:hypothetical protein
MVKLSLSLFVLGVLAADADDPLAADDLAVFADALYGRTDFHDRLKKNYDLAEVEAGGWPRFPFRKVIRPIVRSYGVNSKVTVSPGISVIRFFRIFPEI